jgi:hypothetical protein
MTFYIVLIIAITVWEMFDAHSRRDPNPISNAILTLLIFPIGFPWYLATRNLRPTETREGGAWWNFFKYFIILWTISCVMWAVDSCYSAITPEGDRATQGLSLILGGGFMFLTWLVVTIVALVLGLVLKKNSVIERGPTAPGN